MNATECTVHNAVHRELSVILDAMSHENRTLVDAKPVNGTHLVVFRLHVSHPEDTILVVGFVDEDGIVRVTSNYWEAR